MHILGLPIGRKAALAVLAIGASVIPAQASAADVLFTLTGGTTGTFTLPQSPTPSSYNSIAFIMSNFPANINGNSVTLTAAFDYLVGQSFVDLHLNGTSETIGISSPMFTGPFSAPTFTLGNYQYSGQASGSGTITITQVAGAVPEPTTWAMMLLGFGAIGFAMRRKARVAAPAEALAF